MDDKELFRLAKKKVKKKKGFYIHLQIYVLVNLAITMICIFENDAFGNAPMVLLWGIGLAFHYASVFGMPGGKMTDEWEDKELEKEYNKMKRRYSNQTENRVELPKEKGFNIDEHLDLKEPRKMKDYDDRDFV